MEVWENFQKLKKHYDFLSADSHSTSCSPKRPFLFLSFGRNMVQWNPDFLNPQFHEPPDNSNQKSSPPLPPPPASVQHCNFTPDFSNSPFFEPFSFSLEVRKIGILLGGGGGAGGVVALERIFFWVCLKDLKKSALTNFFGFVFWSYMKSHNKATTSN